MISLSCSILDLIFGSSRRKIHESRFLVEEVRGVSQVSMGYIHRYKLTKSFHFNPRLYLARIKQINFSLFRAVSEVNSKALEIAKECDSERATTTTGEELRGRLHWNYNSCQRCLSHDRRDGIHRHDILIPRRAFLCTMDQLFFSFFFLCTIHSWMFWPCRCKNLGLKQQSLQIFGATEQSSLGKATSTEWPNYRASAKFPNGWSPVGGQCLGIYIKSQSPDYEFN